MGLLIRASQDDLKTPQDFKKDPNCIVCSRQKSNNEINDVERIFGALEDLNKSKEDISKADEKMCDYHAKKARGLKIFSTKDELFELNSQSILKERPDYNKISNDEYDSKVESPDGETKV